MSPLARPRPRMGILIRSISSKYSAIPAWCCTVSEAEPADRTGIPRGSKKAQRGGGERVGYSWERRRMRCQVRPVPGRCSGGDALDAYAQWPAPATIVSDGAYGVGGFLGDPRTADDLAAWYEPHIEVWSKHARASSTLWFWNTELGWATVHPVLARHGWEYVQTVVWDKGIAHIAGNVNGGTIRRFPVITEVLCLLPSPLGVLHSRRSDVCQTVVALRVATSWSASDRSE